MNHTRYLRLMSRLYRNTEAAVAHSNHRVLEVRHGGTADHGSKLRVNLVIDMAYRAAYLAQAGARVVADFLLRRDTVPDFRGELCQNPQIRKPVVQRILLFFGNVSAAVAFYPFADFQKMGDFKELPGA